MITAMWVVFGLASNTLGMWLFGFVGGFFASFAGIENIRGGVFIGFLVYCVVVPLVLLMVLL